MPLHKPDFLGATFSRAFGAYYSFGCHGRLRRPPKCHFARLRRAHHAPPAPLQIFGCHFVAPKKYGCHARSCPKVRVPYSQALEGRIIVIFLFCTMTRNSGAHQEDRLLRPRDVSCPFARRDERFEMSAKLEQRSPGKSFPDIVSRRRSLAAAARGASPGLLDNIL